MEKRNNQKLASRNNSWYMVEYSVVLVNHRSTPLGNLDQVIGLFEGNFLGSLIEVAQGLPISTSIT